MKETLYFGEEVLNNIIKWQSTEYKDGGWINTDIYMSTKVGRVMNNEIGNE